MLLEALGLSAPEYAHIALVVGHDGAPLSKRNGSQTVQELREKGYLPGAVVNYLARLGHTYESNDFLTHEGLANAFDVSRLHKAPARFDMLQLLHWQREAIGEASDEDLWEWMNSVETFGSHPEDFVPADKRLHFVNTIRGNIETPGDAFLWAANLFASSDIYDHEAKVAIEESGESFFSEAIAHYSTGEDFKTYSKKLGQATGKKGKELFMPLRAAVTGEIARGPAVESRWHDGPQMGSIWELLDNAVILRRLKLALEITRKL
jgi:nondiscriminating glutamyl-tRNA synthetase